mgnify:FL=1
MSSNIIRNLELGHVPYKYSIQRSPRILGGLTGYPSIDKPWLKFYEENVELTSIPEGSIYEVVKYNNKDNLNNIALDLRTSKNDFKSGIKISYLDYIKRMDSIAASYSKIGIRKNEILATVLPNIPESRELIYGLNKLGITVYPISPMIPIQQFDKILSENEIKNVVIFSQFYEKFEASLSTKKLNSLLYVTGAESLPKFLQVINNFKNKDLRKKFQLNDNVLFWDEFEKIGKQVHEEITPYYDKDHIAIIVGTSGTTGTPKGVCLTDDNLNAIALQHGLSGIFDKQDVMLDALIQSIGYGISTMHYSTCYGYKNILIPELLLDKYPSVLCRTHPDHFTGGPVHCQYLASSKEFENGILPKAKNIVSGGATLDKSLERKLNNVDESYVEHGYDPKILIRQGLGATENGGCGTYQKQGAYKFGGVGIPLPLDIVSIFKPGTDEELKYNEEGEICISGPTVMKKYLNNDEETSNVLKLHKDGKIWLHLADLGHMDEDGQLYITDRIKNIFMRNGFNVHPSTISSYISSLPEVKECVVVGIDHEKEQCVPVAFVSLVNDNKETLDLIKTKCYENLEETSIPYDYVVMDKLPRNIGGKYDTQLLIDQYKKARKDKEKTLIFKK